MYSCYICYINEATLSELIHMFNSIYTYICLDILFIRGKKQGTQQYLDEATCFLGHIQEYHKHCGDSAALGVCRKR